MQYYDPANHKGRLVLSDLQYAVMRLFYNEGRSYILESNKVLSLHGGTVNALIDKGLLERGRKAGTLRLTYAGEAFMSNFESRDPFKKTISKHFPRALRMDRTFRPTLQTELVKKAQAAHDIAQQLSEARMRPRAA